MMTLRREERIGTVDVWQLTQGMRWPIMRMLAKRFVEEMALGRYLRSLLDTRRWSVVRVVPHLDELGVPSGHVFDIFGVPAARRVADEARR
jgi:hypothetical protein